MSRRSFIKGAAILSAASLAAKALSAVFKIPLDRWFIGPEGIAVYQNAYNIYNWLLAVAATGIPLAVSNMVADSGEDEAAEIRSSAMWLVTALCAVAAVGLFVFAKPLAVWIAGGGSGQAALSIRVMSVGVLFLGVGSAYKGYFQGRGDMTPSAVSQVADSLLKACVGLAICAMLVPKGIETAAAGAMSGVAAGSAVGAAILVIMGKRRIKVYRRPSLNRAKKIAAFAIPVTLGASGFSCMMLVDNFTVQKILVSSGCSVSAATELFGHLTRAFMIYNLPATLIAAVTVSVAPACAEAARQGGEAQMRENVNSASAMLSLVSAPCLFGCLFFSDEILRFLYGGEVHGDVLVFVGALMLLIPFTQVISGILQATGSVWPPIAALGATMAVKLTLNYVLTPRMGVSGAALASVIAYLLCAAVLARLFRLRMGFGLRAGAFAPPLLAAAFAGLAGRAVYALTDGGSLGFLVGAGVMALVYAALMLAVGLVVKKQRK